jgi:hypothetical protein
VQSRQDVLSILLMLLSELLEVAVDVVDQLDLLFFFLVEER